MKYIKKNLRFGSLCHSYFISSSYSVSVTCTRHDLRSKTKPSIPWFQKPKRDSYHQPLLTTNPGPSLIQGKDDFDLASAVHNSCLQVFEYGVEVCHNNPKNWGWLYRSVNLPA